MTTVLGIAGSLRNARHSHGSESFVADIASIESQAALARHLAEQTRLLVEEFLSAGRTQKRPFDEIYRELRRRANERGLSNSEAVLAAGLWGAAQEGARIDHLSLAEHFPPSGRIRDPQGVRDKLLAADGILLSSPVYFGDRSSLVQSFIEFIAADQVLRNHVGGKVYGGLAVGAKRNGGQETTLVYQLLDMVNLDFVAVGNSSETTAQYGGTAVGGDVGTVQNDDDGLETAIGTGRRVARVARLQRLAAGGAQLKDRVRLHMWLLQRDRAGAGLRYFQTWAAAFAKAHPRVDISVWDVAGEEVVRCIACDICPTAVGPADEYRCVIRHADDFFVRHHPELLQADAIMICAYQPSDRDQLLSSYQQFIERTRYLRRDNYVFSDLPVVPFVVAGADSGENMHLRMLTSMVRHHTVLHHPMLGVIVDGHVVNSAALEIRAARFLDSATQLLVGRYVEGGRSDILYNPLGYEISAAKADEDHAVGRVRVELADRMREVAAGRDRRLLCAPVSDPEPNNADG